MINMTDVIEEQKKYHSSCVETFVPLYISNYCDAYCRICNMRNNNNKLTRVRASIQEIDDQLRIIKEIEGISSVCFLTGEYVFGNHRKQNFSLIIAAIKSAFNKFLFDKVYINIGALSDSELFQLKQEFLGEKRLVLSLFQETYDELLYHKIVGSNEPNNPKSSFELRYSTPERWLDSGFTQVDIGILLGIQKDVDEDLEKLIDHATYLFNRGADVAISIPRVRGVDKLPNQITDAKFKDIVLHLAGKCPWAKIIVTTRESINMINELLPIVGIVSPGTSDVVPYTEQGAIPNSIKTSQFQVAPSRPRPSWILDDLNLPHSMIMYYSPNK